ncbi:MAG: radical SAM protein [Deltaproteobacteria bacterium]|nr:radical SAM protein [Deltaproteobacteria bacterium]
MSISPAPAPHPCFNAGAKHTHGRVHLPVAPKCNIKCNYCDRKYDCVNESRPGVTSTVLAPHQALAYLDEVLDLEPAIAVAGIAGPGDPLANAAETLETMRLIKEKYPELWLCLSTNGLALPDHLDEVVAAGATHVTLTVNAVDPAVGEKVYAWARDGKVVYRGRQAAELLFARQEASLRGLKAHGLTVKINTIVLPGVNEHHVAEVAAWAGLLGADLMNLMPLHPNPGTPFGELSEPSRPLMQQLREEAGRFLPQMTHCQRCRADAVGLLHADRSAELAGRLAAAALLPKPAAATRPFTAVASREGVLVNLHLGQAEEFQIWELASDGFRLRETRETPEPGGGDARWREMAALLADCRAVLVSGVGETPRRILTESGVEPLEMSGFILEGLAALYRGDDLSRFRARRTKACCGGPGLGGGDGMGCM